MRRRGAHGGPLIGALVRLPAQELVEMLGVAGFDLVVLDLEHGPSDTALTREHLTLAQLHGMDVLVRPGVREPHLIQRVLDLGASGIVAPHIDDAGAAAELVQWCRYPPEGTRGFAGYTRAGRFGTRSVAEHASAAQDVLVLAMLESVRAVQNTQEIVTTRGIDGYLIGAADLGIDLEHAAEENHGSVSELIRDVHRRAEGSGALRSDLVTSAQQTSEVVAAGSGLVIYNLTAVLMSVLADLAHPVTGDHAG